MSSETIAPVEADEKEWQALERERDESLRTWRRGGTPCGVNYSRRPHPDSYGAHLPMHSDGASMSVLTRTTKAERVQMATRPVVVTRRPLNDVAPVRTFPEHVVTPPHKELVEQAGEQYKRAQLVKRRCALADRGAELSLSFVTSKEPATWIAGLAPLQWGKQTGSNRGKGR